MSPEPENGPNFRYLLVQLSTRVPRELRRRVRLVCVEQGRDLRDFIAKTLREYLRR